MRRWVIAISGAVAALSLSALFVYPVGAVTNTVTLSTAQTVALFGNTIDCEYLATDGTYKTTTATYSSSYLINYDYTYSPEGQTFSGRYVVQYAIPYANDLNVTPSDITIFFKTAVDISSLSYIDTAIVQLSDMDFSTQLFGTYNDYWYCSNGYNYALRAGASGTNEYNYYGYVSSDNYYKYSVIPCLYSSLSDTTFSTGWARCGSFKNATYNSAYYIGFVCPILSEDWDYSGNTGAGSGSSGSESSGSGSGSGSVDLSGILAKLDQIIALMDSSSSSSMPNYTSQLDRMESAINPSYNSQAFSGADLLASYYYENERRLVGDSNFNQGAIDSADFNMPDYSSYGDPVDLVSGFFGSQTLVMPILFGIVFALGIISYILFGKVG